MVVSDCPFYGLPPQFFLSDPSPVFCSAKVSGFHKWQVTAMFLYCMENNAEEVLPLQATPIASAYNAKVREKELVFRIDRLLKELASLKEALLLKGKCSCFLVLIAKDFNS